MKQTSMFTNGEDLPLFSGTPQRVKAEMFVPQAVGLQKTLATCHICYDTGQVRVTSGQVRLTPCTCPFGQAIVQVHLTENY